MISSTQAAHILTVRQGILAGISKELLI